MIVKPSISWISSVSDAELVKQSTAILKAISDNSNYFPTPNPPLAEIITALSQFSTAMANAQGGGVTLTSIKKSARTVLENLLRTLANYLADTCGDNMTMLLASTFPHQKPERTPSGFPETPSNLTVSFGVLGGQLDATIAPVASAVIYNWRIFEASAPTVMVQTAQSTAASTTFSGLTPGLIYTIQANAVNTTGTSDWSAPISKMAV